MAKTQNPFTLHRLAEFGDFIVYRRGPWARRERLPLFLVSRESTGRDLEEFRKLETALKWAQNQARNETPKYKERRLVIQLEDNANEDETILARVLELVRQGFTRGVEPSWEIEQTEA